MQPDKILKSNNALHIHYPESPFPNEVASNAVKQHLMQVIMADTSVTDMSFDKNTVNAEVLKQLASLIWYHNKVNVLLDNQPQWLKGILKSLFSNWLNKRIDGPGYAIEAITIIGNPFTIEMAKILKKILITPPSTKKFRLKLERCELSASMVKTLFTDVSSICELDLSHNQFSDDIFKDIDFSSAGWSQLKILNLSHNALTIKTLNKLNHALNNHLNLVEVNLAQNPCVTSKEMKRLYTHLGDNRSIPSLISKIKAKTLSLEGETIDKSLIRRIDRILRAGIEENEAGVFSRIESLSHIEIEKIDFAGKGLTPEHGLHLEQIALRHHCLKSLINVKNYENCSDSLKRLLAYNCRMEKIVSNQESIKNLLRAGMASTFAFAFWFISKFNLAGLLFHAFYVAPLLGFVLGSTIVLGIQLSHLYFVRELNALKQLKAWDISNRYAAKMGRECQTSWRAYFSPSAWKPAGYIAFRTQAAEQLLPIDQEPSSPAKPQKLTV